MMSQHADRHSTPSFNAFRTTDDIKSSFDSKFATDDEFEVKIDHDAFKNLDRRQSVDSRAMKLPIKQSLTQTNLDFQRLRVSSRKKTKILKDFNGVLLKKSANIFRGWQKRYIHLSENRLCYYK